MIVNEKCVECFPHRPRCTIDKGNHRAVDGLVARLLHVFGLEQARIGFLQILNDLGFALRAEHGRPFRVLDHADFMRQRRPLIEHAQQRLVQRIDLGSELGERLGHGGVRAVKRVFGRGAVQAWVRSNSRIKLISVCTPSIGMAL